MSTTVQQTEEISTTVDSKLVLQIPESKEEEIVLYRVDSEGISRDFTVAEYAEFASKAFEDKEKSCEELEKMQQEKIEKFEAEQFAENCNVDEEIREELNEAEEDIENSSEMSEDVRSMLDEVLRTNVVAAASKGLKKLVSSVKSTVEEETGEKLDSEILTKAFENVKNIVLGNKNETFEEENENDSSSENELLILDENNQEISGADIKEIIEEETAVADSNIEQVEEKYEELQSSDEVVEEEEEEQEEEGVEMNVDELRQEISDAFDHIRGLGALHGKQLADKFRTTFVELNGRAPEPEELVSIFDRLKQQFSDEAQDELLDESETDENENEEEIEKKIESQLIKYARWSVSEKMAEEAKRQFISKCDREPTIEEMDKILVQLVTTRFVDATFDETEEANEEYIPTQEEVDQSEKEDAMEDENEMATVDEITAEIEQLKTDTLESEEKEKSLIDQVDTELMKQAALNFEKFNDRKPNSDELGSLAHYILTTKFTDAHFDSSDESDPDYKPEEESSEDECSFLSETEQN